MEGPGGPASSRWATPGAVRTRGGEAGGALVVAPTGRLGEAWSGRAAESSSRSDRDFWLPGRWVPRGAERRPVRPEPRRRGPRGGRATSCQGAWHHRGATLGRGPERPAAQARRRPSGRVPWELGVGERPGCGGRQRLAVPPWGGGARGTARPRAAASSAPDSERHRFQQRLVLTGSLRAPAAQPRVGRTS